MKIHSCAQEALKHIKDGERIFVQGACATPEVLLKGFAEVAKERKLLEVMHLHTHGFPAYAQKEYSENLRVLALFVGQNVRPFLDYDHVDYLPCFLSEVPRLLKKGERKADVALIHVSEPDRNGFCSLGTSVDVTPAAIEAASTVIAQINKQMPRVHGDGFVHVSQIDHAIKVNVPLSEVICSEPGEAELKIGRLCAELIEDGSCLQMGIGTVPNAVLAALKNHRHLGIHTEMWSDGVLDLVEAGAVDNSKKKVHQGKLVSSFLMGSKRLFEFIHDNPSVIQLGVDYINNPFIISRNPKTVAINSAVEVDLSGQVCADSIGHRIISGVGGQLDFMRGASLSEGGKPIIAINSRTPKGNPKIVPFLREGAGVVTTRNHAHYVVTEYGVAQLQGKTMRERARAMIDIAHPEDREFLEKQWRENYGSKI